MTDDPRARSPPRPSRASASRSGRRRRSRAKPSAVPAEREADDRAGRRRCPPSISSSGSNDRDDDRADAAAMPTATRIPSRTVIASSSLSGRPTKSVSELRRLAGDSVRSAEAPRRLRRRGRLAEGRGAGASSAHRCSERSSPSSARAMSPPSPSRSIRSTSMPAARAPSTSSSVSPTWSASAAPQPASSSARREDRRVGLAGAGRGRGDDRVEAAGEADPREDLGQLAVPVGDADEPQPGVAQPRSAPAPRPGRPRSGSRPSSSRRRSSRPSSRERIPAQSARSCGQRVGVDRLVRRGPRSRSSRR